ncbi:unnamed protein product [Ranitomeya imitator]|uniref:Elongation of very long chain fatty acids protein n=1 Tax=Ranitomeya imitator TaxID=111125 RepID=A0ABN9M0X0_9NEOB|nr:unnamed protein product [Ranitomeya imitator]
MNLDNFKINVLLQLILSTWEGGYNLQCQNLDSAGEADVRENLAPAAHVVLYIAVAKDRGGKNARFLGVSIAETPELNILGMSINLSSCNVAKVLWWYYFSKAIEFMDTIFFVLRKKNSQITFLHVYHHATMFNIWWCVMNWIPCGQSFFGPTLNSFIHVLMYSYYGLSVIPSMHKYLWWKKYLTQAQLIQFLLTISHTLSAVVKPCGFPFGCLIFQSSYMTTLVLLFVNFYLKIRRF